MSKYSFAQQGYKFGVAHVRNPKCNIRQFGVGSITQHLPIKGG